MKRFAVVFVLLVIINANNILFGQGKSIRVGIEPYYNHLFYRWDFQQYDRVSRNIYGIGLIVEKSISKMNDSWTIRSGLSYFFLQSYTDENRLMESIKCNQYSFLRVEKYIRWETDFKSHNLRLPVKLVFNNKNIRISTGLLFDYEIKNQLHGNVKYYDEGPCDVDSMNGIDYQDDEYRGELENNRFSCGWEFGIGYSFNMIGKYDIIPAIYYHL